MRDVAGFEEFVGARSSRLLTTAYLLTGDHGRAEDLVQTALAKAWCAWARINGEPEAYTRKVMVNTYASWWRRRWNDERPTGDLPERGYDEDSSTGHDLWVAVGRLPAANGLSSCCVTSRISARPRPPGCWNARSAP